jgi:hypothetical protein
LPPSCYCSQVLRSKLGAIKIPTESAVGTNPHCL